MIRWAVMGTGRFALGVLPRIVRSPGNRVTVVSSRDRARAEEAGRRAGVAACGHDEVSRRGDVDAVYIALPNHVHVEWSKRMLEAGKHVLCEKPLCATRSEAEAVRDAARRAGRLCVEGFMYMHHPQTARLVELARAARDGHGPIGRPRVIRANRNVRNTDPYILSTRLSHAMRGGALMDIGCYPLSLGLLLGGEEPAWSTLRAAAEMGRWVGDAAGGWIERPSGERIVIGAVSERAAAPPLRSGFVDESCEFSFDFPSGLRFEGAASFTKGSAGGASVFCEVIGERGRAFTTHPFSPDAERQVLTVESAGERIEEVFERGGDKFENQFERFARAVRGECEPMPTMEWSVREAEALERIHRAIGVSW